MHPHWLGIPLLPAFLLSGEPNALPLLAGYVAPFFHRDPADVSPVSKAADPVDLRDHKADEMGLMYPAARQPDPRVGVGSDEALCKLCAFGPGVEVVTLRDALHVAQKRKAREVSGAVGHRVVNIIIVVGAVLWPIRLVVRGAETELVQKLIPGRAGSPAAATVAEALDALDEGRTVASTARRGLTLLPAATFLKLVSTLMASTVGFPACSGS